MDVSSLQRSTLHNQAPKRSGPPDVEVIRKRKAPARDHKGGSPGSCSDARVGTNPQRPLPKIVFPIAVEVENGNFVAAGVMIHDAVPCPADVQPQDGEVRV